MKVLITGAEGFIGKNLRLYLSERKDVEIVSFTRADSVSSLREYLNGVDFVFHLAGVNRSENTGEFQSGNVEFTRALVESVSDVSQKTSRLIPVLYTSSTQVERDNVYGKTKREAEEVLLSAKEGEDLPVHIFRLPNVFGKWCRPNYNSAVATFCHNIARGLPIQIHDPDALVTLVYIDDVVKRFAEVMEGVEGMRDKEGLPVVEPRYTITVGELARELEGFRECRNSLLIGRVGHGLSRKLYATYVSYLPPEAFSYGVPQHADPRGEFVEMLKTYDSGQFSFFKARPGVTRGGHYHHTKTEKFLVVSGTAHFRFRHMQSGEMHEIVTSSGKSEIVETIPGWAHDITNIGETDLIVMLWANEIFDRAAPDTFSSPL